MAKDAGGHGSDAHGVAGAIAKALVKPGTTAMHPELGRVTIVKVNKDGSAVVRDSTGTQGTTMVRGLSQDPAARSGALGVADQHGISTSHLDNAPGAGFVRGTSIRSSPFPDHSDFVAKYGGPRDHAAEQRSFNSGKREINRLKRQGK